MQKTAIKLAVAAVLGVSGTTAHAFTITWADGPGVGNLDTFKVGPGLTTPSAINSTPFTQTAVFPPPNPRNSEFRMIDPTGTVGGGGEKSIIDGIPGESWSFCQNCFSMTGTGAGFPSNPGAFAGAAPTASTNPTMGQAAPFFGPGFNFLAPAQGTLAGAAYGFGTINFDSTDNFTMHFPILEAQWGGTYFPLGLANNNAGITFNCTGATTGSVNCAAEHTIDASVGEDPGAAGFNGWTAQWYLQGSMTPVHQAPVIPVPAAVWLFGSGLIGLVGVARRRRNTV